MSDLQNLYLDKSGWVDTEIQIDGNQSAYVFDMIRVWKRGTEAYLSLKLRNNGSNQKASHALQEALKYDVTNMAYSLSVELMKYYTYRGDAKKTDYYTDLSTELNSLVNAELLAQQSVINIDKKILKKLSTEFIIEELETSIKEIDQVINDYESLDFLLFAYLLKIRKAQLQNDKITIVKLCKEAMRRFENKQYDLPHVVYLFFMHPPIPLLIEAKKFDEAVDLINLLKSKLEEKTVNWFSIHSYEVILNFRRLDFDRAGELVDEVRKIDNAVHFERYQIYDAYCSLFSNRSFKLGKFTNSVFEFNKDRKGYRVTIVIVRLLHLLKYKKHGDFIDRVTAVELYMHRYLKSTSKRVKRSRYFLKCLLLVAHKRVNFNRVAWERRTKDIYQNILDTPKDELNQLTEQEPVDFEHLYFFVKGLLK